MATSFGQTVATLIAGPAGKRLSSHDAFVLAEAATYAQRADDLSPSDQALYQTLISASKPAQGTRKKRG
jgi:hypothetical protein